MYKLIVSDLDGTLLRKDHTISEYTKSVIKNVTNQGVQFMLATGRIFGGAKIFSQDLGIDTPILACNGGLIKDTKGKILFSKPIPSHSLIQVFQILMKHQYYFHFYGHENFYTQKFWEEWTTFYAFNELLPEHERFPMYEVSNPIDIVEKDPIYKVLVHCEGEEKRTELYEQLLKIPGISLTSSWSDSYDICASQVNKSFAIDKYAKEKGILSSEIICFGDNYNDMDMIKYAGLGIAVDNAVDELKSIADYITDTNDCDGVAKALEKFIP